MKTWEDYKNHVKSIDAESGRNIEEIEEIAAIVSSMIERRTALGISQRTLAESCGLPQSSVARIESFKTTPKIDTLVKLMHPLGLKLQVAAL
ncbi:DNA-binding helix-turn-helix protein [Selenomonas sp. FOBRC6]|jgi:transcriptional regulator, XRE family|uniref:helix-turn-helix domain-containing protein n=1 Tax=Selenomonas sp. FOBRC6 TaxID=936572 RepID=UPI000277FA58|nr:helix-turn-helix transcriptional regulator [Selenomonas sp. FOBRC6]EJO19808.1 DNA-binding helix-turn-helix protein [Selenomonas sp. FOBRC6]